MKRYFKRMISFILVLTMMVTAMPVSALTQPSVDVHQNQENNETVQGPIPDTINNAVAKFLEAVSKFSQDTAAMDQLSGYLTRFGGITSLASGVIGILTMVGTIKDPTTVALRSILEEVHNIEDQLSQMNVKLDNIRKDLVDIAVSIEEKDRNNKAFDMLNNWSSFNTSYCEPLDDMIKVYETKVDEGIAAWWKEPSRDGVWVPYTLIKDEPSLTYSNHDYSEGLPEKADNGESVSVDYSFGVPAEYIPDQSALGKWTPDTYRQNFESKMAANLITAADEHKLEANDAFYAAWDALSADKKAEKAQTYAMDILNTEIYHIACRVMSENNEWVTTVSNQYRKYCDNILSLNSGVNALLNAMYLTHAFEGETKKDIEDLCDSMIVKTGFYGQFVLTCVCQDDMQSMANREAVQKQFADTIISLSEKKKHAITGYNNYCYITGTRIVRSTVDAKTVTHIQEHNDDFEGCTAEPWSISLPPILNNVYAEVLYHQYKALNDPSKLSFANYLYGFGVFKDKNFKGYIMTNYQGAVPFGLNEGLLLQRCPIRGCNGVYFGGNKEKWSINVGNDSDVNNQYFQVHEKLLFDAFDMGEEKLLMNLLGGARAFYGETHWYWIMDVMCHFHYESTNPLTRHYQTRSGKRSDGTELFSEYLTTTFSIFKLEPIDQNKIVNNLESPFKAFGAPSLNSNDTNVYDKIVASTNSSQKTTINNLTLNKSSFVYTGKEIKPSVTVKAGSAVVPATGYDVAYSGNKDVGAGIVTVTGKGDYTGSISKRFTILPKGTSISKIKRTKVKTTAAVTWKKQSSKMASTRITGYQIRYSTKKSMKGAKTVKVKGYSKASKKIKGFKNKKKYYFQIRTYMTLKKKTLYSAWSKKKALK